MAATVGAPMGTTRLAADRRVCRLSAQLSDLKRMSDAMEQSCASWMCGQQQQASTQPQQLTQASTQEQLVASLLSSRKKNRRKACVIGGGCSGLITVKELVEAGVDDVQCYELQDGPGGLYRRDNYEFGCHTSSYCFTSFTCYPPEDVTQCGHYTLSEYVRYLESFVEAFELKDFIKWKHCVQKVTRDADGDWLVTVMDLETKAAWTERYEVVVVASGTHTNKNDPRETHEWLQNFRGDVLHSSEYRTHEHFKNKNVIIVGGGESASDIAVHTAKVAKQSWLSTKERVGHMTPRGAHLPEDDHKYYERVEAHKKCPEKHLPEAGFDNDLTWMMYSCSDAFFPLHAYRDALALATFDFLPGAKVNVYSKSNVYSQFGCKNAGWSSAIARYGCQPKPPIHKCLNHKVTFEDGTTASDVDAIVVCVGYRNDIVFLDEKVKKKVLNPRNCMKHVAHPEVSNFYLVGFVRPAFGNIPSIAEMQARWIAQLVTKKKKLPPKDEMCAIVEKDRAWEESTYAYAGKKLKPLTSYYHQMMDLATLTESHPDYGALLFEDPALFAKIVMGQFTGFQFRLRDCSPELKARYRKLIMKMPIANIWSFDLAIIVTAFHGYLVLGGFDAFKLKGTTPFQNMAPLSRRLLAVVLLGNPFYLLLVALPCFLVCVAAFLFVQLNSVRIASNLDFFRGGLNRPAHYLLKGPFDTLHVYWARVQLATFMLVTMPYDLALTLLFKKHLQGQSHLPTSKFMEMENNYKKQIGEFAFTH